MSDKLSELAAMTDEELSKVIGLTKKLDDAREELAEMDKLDGEARKIALERVEKMFQPNIYPDEFKWIKDDAVREAARKTKKDAPGNCCCGGTITDPADDLQEMGNEEPYSDED